MKIYGRALWKYGLLFSLWFNVVVIAALYLAPELLDFAASSDVISAYAAKRHADAGHDARLH